MSAENEEGIQSISSVSRDSNAGPTAEDILTETRPCSEMQLPSVDRILSDATAECAPLSSEDSPEIINPEDEKETFRSLQQLLKTATASDDEQVGNLDLRGLQVSLDEVEGDSIRTTALKHARTILHRLCRGRSTYMTSAAELLADNSRDPSWRAPYGRSGILELFLQLIASKEDENDDVLLHSLRFVGNSCADTDENRAIVVKHNYTLAILRRFLNPNLIQVAVPAVYNICVDYEPAQSRLATNKLGYVLLKLIQDHVIQNDKFLDLAYELVEMITESGSSIECSPDGTILLLVELAVNRETEFAHYACLVNCLASYLQNKRFQDFAISNDMVDSLLSILDRSFTCDVDESSSEDVRSLAQMRLKINQFLAELSASPLFIQHYPLNSRLARTLESWLTSRDNERQICACVMLGNLARSDEVCRLMVRDLNMHEELIKIVHTNESGPVLHATLGFLRNLVVFGDNRPTLGQAGVIPAICRLWSLEVTPQVQLSAISLARQVIISCPENISRLLEPVPHEPHLGLSQLRTYLSVLLSLSETTDSTPIKTEIGRMITSICRTIVDPRGQVETALSERFFSLDSRVARPLGAMVIQTQWPVVRSEGLFALALMASAKAGSIAVADCLQQSDMYQLLIDILSAQVTESTNDVDKVEILKDRENTILLVKKLLENNPDCIPNTWKQDMERLLNEQISNYLSRR